MKIWKRHHTLLALTVGFAIGISTMPALNGCAAENSTINRMAEVIGLDPYGLPEESQRELTRFNAVYTTYADDPGDTRQLKLFRDAFKRVRSSYVRDIPDRELIDAAIAEVEKDGPAPGSLPSKELVEIALDGMTAALDPHSVYLNPEELRETELVTTGEFGGLGIQVSQEEDVIKIISPIDDTPAAKVGITAGDLITHIDGDSVAGIKLLEAVHRMRGRPGTSIRLTIQRAEVEPFDVIIVRDIITIRPVRWSIEDDVGYLRIVGFNEKAESELRDALGELRSALGPNARGMVIDLRSNPGGLLDQSLAVADAFLDDGAIVSIRGRDPATSRTYGASRGDLSGKLPLVVLIDGGSASASEIVAAALQDHGRAIVMGRQSFGKGSVQTLMPLPIEGALKLTTALYYSPSGLTIQARGVEPDIVLVRSEADADAEAAKREIDLPNALPEEGVETHEVKATLNAEEDCQPAGEKEDHELGCAIALLRAGSADRFLAVVSERAGL